MKMFRLGDLVLVGRVHTGYRDIGIVTWAPFGSPESSWDSPSHPCNVDCRMRNGHLHYHVQTAHQERYIFCNAKHSAELILPDSCDRAQGMIRLGIMP